MSLLALRPLIEVTEKFHQLARTDEAYAEDAAKLIDGVSILSQSIYKTNVYRVSG